MKFMIITMSMRFGCERYSVFAVIVLSFSAYPILPMYYYTLWKLQPADFGHFSGVQYS